MAQIRHERTSLTDLYHPYICPSDTCLNDARQRLQTALEQTRLLRKAFTERVYGKYRVCLIPPPPSLTALLQPIQQNPTQALERLQHEMEQVRAEKEVEKKQAAQLNVQLQSHKTSTPSSGTTTTTPSAATSLLGLPPNMIDHAEQLMYLSAGLNLVLLPEDSTTLPPDVLLEHYPNGRGPMLENGQRNRAISHAAATSGDVILDRTRKAIALRRERQQEQPLPEHLTDAMPFLSTNTTSDATSAVPVTATATAAVLSAAGSLAAVLQQPQPSDTAAVPPPTVMATATIKDPLLGAMGPTTSNSLVPSTSTATSTVPSTTTTATTSAVAITASKRSTTTTATTAMGGTACKVARGRTSAIVSSTSLLNLLPQAEQLATSSASSTTTTTTTTAEQQAPWSAATAALVARGIGSHLITPGSTTSYHHKTQAWRFRHPHPDSFLGRGGRRTSDSTSSSSSWLEDATLPPLPLTTKDRLDRPPLEVLSPSQAATPRATRAINRVLAAFGGCDTANTTTCSKEKQQDKERSPSVPFTSLLRQLRTTTPPAATPTTINPSTSTGTEEQPVSTATTSGSNDNSTGSKDDPETKEMDPMVAFLVLSSIGLIGPRTTTTNMGETLDEKLSKAPIETTSSTNSATGTTPLTKTLDQLRMELSSPCPSVTHTFTTANGGRKRNAVATDQDTDDMASDMAPAAKRIRRPSDTTTTVSAVPVESIRGGGAEQQRAVGGNDNANPSSSQPATLEGNTPPLGIPSNVPSSNFTLAAAPGYLTPSPATASTYPGLHTLQLAQQLQQSTAYYHPHHPSSTAELTSHHPFSYNMSSQVPQQQPPQPSEVFVPPPSTTTQVYGGPISQPPPGSIDTGVAQPPLPQQLAFGMARQDQIMAQARARFSQEQQAAAFFAANTNRPYVPQPSTVSALLGNPHHYLSSQQQPQQQQQLAPYSIQTPMMAPTNTPVTQFTQPIHSSFVSAPTTSGVSTTTSIPTIAERQPQEVMEQNTRNTTSQAQRPTEPTTNPLGPPVESRDAISSPDETTNEEKIVLPMVKDGNEPRIADQTETQDVVPKTENKEPSVVSQQGVPKSSATIHDSEKTTQPEKSTLSTESKTLDGPETKPGVPKDSAATFNAVDKDKVPPPTKATVSSTTTITTDVELKFVPPVVPAQLEEREATLIRTGRLHSLLEEGATTMEKLKAAMEYLLAVSAAIPISKTLISLPLKECLNLPGLGTSGATTINRDIVASSILVWLWANHEATFRMAFCNSGRIDADPDCKWWIQSSVDICARDLVHEVAKERSTPSGDGVHAQLAAARKLLAAKKQQQQGSGNHVALENSISILSSRVDIHAAAVVCRSLAKQVSIDNVCDTMLFKYDKCLKYLEEACMVALQAKAQERTLLANLISRKATMTESFSHAYTSAMVRAGEAIGHGKLFEIVQNEQVGISTMIPYDVFTDEETQDWEDPCKPLPACMSLGLTADELTRRAHARAMIQKSLKKLQDKQPILQGGTAWLGAGPYSDPGTVVHPSTSSVGGRARFPPATSPRSTGVKRKSTVHIEPPVPPGTGSAKATSWTVFHPRHFTEPLSWDPTALQVLPYGKHVVSDRPRSSLSNSLIANKRVKKQQQQQQQPVAGVQAFGQPGKPQPTPPEADNNTTTTNTVSDAPPPPPDDGSQEALFPQSTVEIPWSDVADIFQKVELPKKSRSSSASTSHHHSHGGHHGGESTPLPIDGKIFAPFCRKVQLKDLVEEEEEDGEDDPEEEEEDLSEAAILSRHQAVLDRMKHKLSQYLEERRKQQERRKSRGSTSNKGRS